MAAVLWVLACAHQAPAAGVPEGMVLIPAGNFLMGSPKGRGESEEHPQHKVYLDAFYIDRTDVTFDAYDKFCDATGRSKPADQGWGRGTRPVINVSWDDARAYAQWAGKRLPAEAQWEKAARGPAGTDQAAPLGDYAWYLANSSDQSHPVGEKKANGYGLYDMWGDVWQWCLDWYGEAYYAKSPFMNPMGPSSGEARVYRGGSWSFDETGARSTARNWFYPGASRFDLGFRCVRAGKGS
jgi:formylglycine-generating enzyme required for sulfatase activity